MTERIRYSTAYIHEFAAKIEQMVFDGYCIDHDSAFCARRRGSAYEIHFIPTRECLDFDGLPLTDSEEKWEIDEDMEHDPIGPTGNEHYVDPLDIEGGEKEVAESEDCGTLFFTKESLDELYWTALQEVGRKFGVKQRDRKKLTKMILEAQEKDK